jgi:hypothetical protein
MNYVSSTGERTETLKVETGDFHQKIGCFLVIELTQFHA